MPFITVSLERYREMQREFLNSIPREYVECPCGGKSNYASYHEHLRTKRHRFYLSQCELKKKQLS